MHASMQLDMKTSAQLFSLLFVTASVCSSSCGFGGEFSVWAAAFSCSGFSVSFSTCFWQSKWFEMVVVVVAEGSSIGLNAVASGYNSWHFASKSDKWSGHFPKVPFFRRACIFRQICKYRWIVLCSDLMLTMPITVHYYTHEQLQTVVIYYSKQQDVLPTQQRTGQL